MAVGPIVFLGIVALGILVALDGIHKVDEGFVGIYFRGGSLQNRTTKPGYHFKIPFLDRAENVQISVQTDQVTDIPCGTSGGVLIWFGKSSYTP